MLWDPQIHAATRSLCVPPPLEDLHWEAAGVRAPGPSPSSIELVGIVLPPGADGRADVARLWLRSAGSLDDWGLQLNELDLRDRILPASTARAVRRHVAALLS